MGCKKPKNLELENLLKITWMGLTVSVIETNKKINCFNSNFKKLTSLWVKIIIITTAKTKIIAIIKFPNLRKINNKLKI